MTLQQQIWQRIVFCGHSVRISYDARHMAGILKQYITLKTVTSFPKQQK